MKALLSRWYFGLLPVCLFLLVFAGCDEHDSQGVTDIIYAIGDVILGILDTIFQATG